MPVETFVGLVNEAAFDLSEEIPPTGAVYAALEEWRAEYNKELALKEC